MREPLLISKSNFFIKTGQNKGIPNNNNDNFTELGNNLKTISTTDTNKLKDSKKNISKSKTHSKYKQKKSFSGNSVNPNENSNTIKLIDTKEAYNPLHFNNTTRKSNNNIRCSLNLGNKNNIINNKIFLKKHIVIESKNKNKKNDTRKNNNSSINSSNNNNNNKKNNVDNNANGCFNYNLMGNNENIFNFDNKINLILQGKNSDNNIKEYNKISNFQNIFNGDKHKSKQLVLRDIFNNNDF